MDEVVRALRDQVDELDAMVSGLGDTDWERPSACPGWSVADMLVHLAQTNEVAIASVQHRWSEVVAMWDREPGETDGVELAGAGEVIALWDREPGAANVDELAGAAVEKSTLRSGPAVHEWWQQTAEAMVAAFDEVDPRARVQWVVGDMAARSLCTTRLSETWIHTTDIAHGLGVQVAPTDRLWHIARLVHRTIPYSFRRAEHPAPDRVRFVLSAPDGTTWTFGDDDAPTVVSGPAHQLCLVAGQRADAADTSLVATGPDAQLVLALMRTFA